jgi:hypothetical protein
MPRATQAMLVLAHPPFRAPHGAHAQVLDVCTAVQPNYWCLKEISMFLMAPNSLDPAMGLGLYLKIGPSEWLYRGCVHNAHPTEVMPLQVRHPEGPVFREAVFP